MAGDFYPGPSSQPLTPRIAQPLPSQDRVRTWRVLERVCSPHWEGRQLCDELTSDSGDGLVATSTGDCRLLRLFAENQSLGILGLFATQSANIRRRELGELWGSTRSLGSEKIRALWDNPRTYYSTDQSRSPARVPGGHNASSEVAAVCERIGV
jgi:hypothetical protein